jgi:integrase
VAKGTIRLDHRTRCPLRGASGEAQFDNRRCKCGPRVVARLNSRDTTLGHLAPGWRKDDLGELEDKLHDLRNPNRRKLAERSPTLRQFYAEWKPDVLDAAVARGEMAWRSVDSYDQRWRLHISKDPIADMPINAIDARELRRFVTRRIAKAGISYRYANELLTPISAMLTDATIDGWIESNPARQPRRARHGRTQRNEVYKQLDRQPPKHLTRDSARALVLAVDPSFRLMILWVLVTGARRAEMLAAIHDDVSLVKREVAIHYQLDGRSRKRVPVKAGRQREVVLWSGLERLLLGRRTGGTGTGYIFARSNGTAPLLGTGDGALRDALKAIGEHQPGRLWHALRDTYATYLRSQGVRWEAVEYMLGHRLRDTTGRYVHLLAEDRETVEAALTAAFGGIVEMWLEPTNVARR